MLDGGEGVLKGPEDVNKGGHPDQLLTILVQ